MEDTNTASTRNSNPLDAADSSSTTAQSAHHDVEYPKEFICPITQEVMEDPVVCSDGFSYERFCIIFICLNTCEGSLTLLFPSRQAITRWLIQQNTSPTTGAILVSNNLTPNYNLRSLIQTYRHRVTERRKNRYMKETTTKYSHIN